MYKILLLLLMIFLHIVDDFHLQGWLTQAKQKSYWKQNAPDKLYKHDYIMALFIHSFSWSFMVMIVPTIYLLIKFPTSINEIAITVMLFFIFNLLMHMGVDDSKANKRRINLVKDQLIHFCQIIYTWFILIVLING